MLENQIDCDVWFTLLPSCGDELPVTVGCHRYVLVSRSPVFFAMLSGPLAAAAASHRTTQFSGTTPATPPRCKRRYRNVVLYLLILIHGICSLRK